MKRKYLYLTGYFLLMVVSLFSLITDIISIVNHTYEVGTSWVETQMIVFAVVFGLLFLISSFLFIVWLLKVLKDISINKENK